MEAVITKNNFSDGVNLKKVLKDFFKDNTPDSTNVLFWKFFQCWVTRDCKIKADLTDEKIAIFFDQLTELIDAAYVVYQENLLNADESERNGNSE